MIHSAQTTTTATEVAGETTTTMATEEEEKRWGARLKERGFVVRRINLQNDRMMENIYTLLGVTEDFPKQTQVDEFIEKQKDANGEKSF